jgi:hypothetical protein
MFATGTVLISLATALLFLLIEGLGYALPA